LEPAKAGIATAAMNNSGTTRWDKKFCRIEAAATENGMENIDLLGVWRIRRFFCAR
jgi:hypothetical protein